MNSFLNRVNISLSEYIFIFIIRSLVIEIFEFEVHLKPYGKTTLNINILRIKEFY